MEKSSKKKPLVFKWPLLFEGEGGPLEYSNACRFRSSKHLGFAFKIQIMIYSYGNRTSWEYCIWILHRKNGTQSPIFRLLQKIALGILKQKIGVFSPQKSSYWPMDSRKGHQLGGGFGCVSFTSGCIRGVFVRCRGVPGEKPYKLFTKKPAFCR